MSETQAPIVSQRVKDAPKRSGHTVTVASKLPYKMELRLCDFMEEDVLVMGGGVRRVKVARPLERTIEINGNCLPRGIAPEFQITGGHALTSGVDGDFFDRWLKENADLTCVRKGMIFAHESTSHVEGRAREQAALRTGLEPLDPKRPIISQKVSSAAA